MAIARRESGAAGTQTASVVFGGALPPGNNDVASTEEYYGFNYSAGGNMTTAREGMGAAGTQIAALAFGGANYGTPEGVSKKTETYNGSSWTAVNDMNNVRSYVAGFGLQTAAIAVGGAPSSPIVLTTESWDGTNWTNLSSPSNVPVGMFTNASCGTQTAGLIFGGSNVSDSPPGAQSTTIDWNGSAWTAGNNMNTARRRLGGAGTSTAALGFGGYLPSPFSAATEEYDGNTWTTSSASLPTATAHMHGSGSMYAALSSGGVTSTAFTGATYEYDSNINAVTTTAAWGSGGNYPGPVHSAGSSTNSPSTASVAFGGYVSGSKSSATNEYNGSSWTSANAMSDTFTSGAYGGTQTTAFGAGGYANPPSRTAATEEYDGTNWTGGGALSVAAAQNVGFGTSTAGVVYGGEGSPDPAIKTSTQEYDGSSWTTVNTMPVGASGHGTGFGTQTAGVRNSGTAPPPNTSTWDNGPASFVNITLLYDGTNWTSGANSGFGGRNSTGFGIQTSGVSCGGEGAPGTTPLTRTEQYDGTGWSDVATIPRTSNSYSAGFGASSSSGAIVGGTGPTTNSTDEYTGQVITTTASTLTTS
jgi:hypothetical protein